MIADKSCRTDFMGVHEPHYGRGRPRAPVVKAPARLRPILPRSTHESPGFA
jgi:hypothetical protein